MKELPKGIKWCYIHFPTSHTSIKISRHVTKRLHHVHLRYFKIIYEFIWRDRGRILRGECAETMVRTLHLGCSGQWRTTDRYIQRVHCTGTASSILRDTDVFCKNNSDNNCSQPPDNSAFSTTWFAAPNLIVKNSLKFLNKLHEISTRLCFNFFKNSIFLQGIMRLVAITYWAYDGGCLEINLAVCVLFRTRFLFF